MIRQANRQTSRGDNPGKMNRDLTDQNNWNEYLQTYNRLKCEYQKRNLVDPLVNTPDQEFDGAYQFNI